jgi:hypothetical protein
MTAAATQLQRARAGEEPCIYTMFADFTSAPIGDNRAGWLQQVGMVSGTLATDLFLAKAAWADRAWPRIKEWGYLRAVEFVGARKSAVRKRSLVESYRVDWGHQAARDGIAIALWGPTGVPGSRERALSFKCGQQAYRRVRDEVGAQAADLVTEAAHFLEMCAGIRPVSGEFIRRWEDATGASWDVAKWCSNA